MENHKGTTVADSAAFETRDPGSGSLGGKSQQKAYMIAEHAVRLFTEQGFAAVTIDDISQAAGIGSRTFFRYFPTKESAAFPDHGARVERFATVLDASRGTAEPFSALLRASEKLTDDYFAMPELYKPRYRLIRTEPVLRDFERVRDTGYENLISRYLTDEYAQLPEIGILAPVAAAGIVATVNTVLEGWAAEESRNPAAQLHEALELLYTLFEPAFSKAPTSPAFTGSGMRGR
jgi:AcrR family transcriptional regulator